MSESGEIGLLQKDIKPLVVKDGGQEQSKKVEGIIDLGTAGKQLAILSNVFPGGKDTFPNGDALKQLKETAAKGSGKQFNASELTAACNNTIDREWESSGLSQDEQKKRWIDKTNELWGKYEKDSPEDKIMQKIGIGSDIINRAELLRQELVLDNNREVGYFAKKVADNLTSEEIGKNPELLRSIAMRIYGEKFAVEVIDLIKAIKNMQDNPDMFVQKAREQFILDDKMPGADVIKEIYAQSKEWKAKEKKRKDDLEEKAAKEAEAKRIKKEQEDLRRKAGEAPDFYGEIERGVKKKSDLKTGDIASQKDEVKRSETEQVKPVENEHPEAVKTAKAEEVMKEDVQKATEKQGEDAGKKGAEITDLAEVREKARKVKEEIIARVNDGNNIEGYKKQLLEGAKKLNQNVLEPEAQALIGKILSIEMMKNSNFNNEKAKYYPNSEDSGVIVVGKGSDFGNLMEELDKGKFYEKAEAGNKKVLIALITESEEPNDQVSRAVWDLRNRYPGNVAFVPPLIQMPEELRKMIMEKKAA